jgi:long-chain acyl-CoA synthetase
VVSDAPVSLTERFIERAQAHPDAVALRVLATAPSGEVITTELAYQSLLMRARALAAGLLHARRPGEAKLPLEALHGQSRPPEDLPPAARVVIVSESRLEWVVADLACALAGLVSVPLFPNVELATLRRVLAACDAQVVIAENPWQARKVLEAAAAGAEGQPPLSVPTVVLMDPTLRLASGAVQTFEELGGAGLSFMEVERRGAERLLRAGPQADLRGDGDEAMSDDACWTIAYSPGTEGEPKGAMWTVANIVAATAALGPHLVGPKGAPEKSEGRSGRRKDGELVLIGAPLAQALGRVALWSTLAGPPHPDGVPPTVALPRSEATFFDDARRLAPTAIVATPSLYARARAEVVRGLRARGPVVSLLSRWADPEPSPQGETTFFGRARASLGGRVVRPALAERFGARVRLLVSAGAPLDEGVQGFFVRHGLALRQGYGLIEALGITHLDLTSPPRIGNVGPPLGDLEQRLGPDGELLVRGPQVSPGYWRDPLATDQCLSDGWLATGDLAHTDLDDSVTITGRKREIIVLTNGRTVAPRPIEALLREDPLVAQVLVHGHRRPFVTALIALDKSELQAFARELEPHADPGHTSATEPGSARPSTIQDGRHPAVHARIEALVQRTNQRLPPHAVVRKFAILPAEITAESGALTPTRTLRRALTADRFRSILESFYAESY